ncbi:MAG: hypothetical protein MZU95_11120 [Desulfomicrobium escambiense]|nr:hypothetical protein [Desulfomicrobium escambiense]
MIPQPTYSSSARFARWIPTYNINYILGIDGITIFLILLTTLLAPICVLCSWTAIEKQGEGVHVLHPHHGKQP